LQNKLITVDLVLADLEPVNSYS